MGATPSALRTPGTSMAASCAASEPPMIPRSRGLPESPPGSNTLRLDERYASACRSWAVARLPKARVRAWGELSPYRMAP